MANFVADVSGGGRERREVESNLTSRVGGEVSGGAVEMSAGIKLPDFNGVGDVGGKAHDSNGAGEATGVPGLGTATDTTNDSTPGVARVLNPKVGQVARGIDLTNDASVTGRRSDIERLIATATKGEIGDKVGESIEVGKQARLVVSIKMRGIVAGGVPVRFNQTTTVEATPEEIVKPKAIGVAVDVVMGGTRAADGETGFATDDWLMSVSYRGNPLISVDGS